IESVKNSETAISKLSEYSLKRITCFYPLLDEVVPKKDMKIQGANKKLIPFAFHVPGIVFALLFQARRLLKL
ncbi:MAG: hypothetical protein R3313_05575, partial [Candidatus Saccharimonadales bacterium]|nr:hypothetical protein [Candidatus Saccharimonadales bacterium]